VVPARRIAEYRDRYDNPWRAAARGYVDDVIDPSRTRPTLIGHLRALSGKKIDRPYRKHGNVPL
ncbi:MAG: carboxyl transferase domain-containing protein, partial [Trueperaceae bacterium]